MDSPSNMNTARLLKTARGKLGYLFNIEERYWAQRARIQWLREEDRNTHFFHVRATSRKKKNSIDRLKDSNGVWHEDCNEICDVAWNYFNNLFKSSIIDDNSMNRDLDREFIDVEIMLAFNQMDPRKAPGTDGLSGSFFREHWQTVGEDVLKFCHEALRDTKNIHTVNDTLLVLIPKVDNPCDMSNFRPISLCRRFCSWLHDPRQRPDSSRACSLPPLLQQWP
ncbi:reverse transcriptase [Gossypium australe]|uniref:Reverse transcriptase n=1 Tax=Gossypium australe TaxID=47621 RepID=A0A5B6WPY9_9ROSI|nr:reverse transcriptase [Gossypium australe]